MLPADILMSDDATDPVSTALVWMDHLDLIVKTDARWPIDHRLQFTLMLDDETATGMAEVRAKRVVGDVVGDVAVKEAGRGRVRDGVLENYPCEQIAE